MKPLQHLRIWISFMPHCDSHGLPDAFVGIFWGIPDGQTYTLVLDRTPLSEAEPYGEALTHPRGHYEVWEQWRRLGPAGLARRNLPTAIVWHEYEHFPRGRVVYRIREQHFIVYADRSEVCREPAEARS
jgi:hypothetical protein